MARRAGGAARRRHDAASDGHARRRPGRARCPPPAAVPDLRGRGRRLGDALRGLLRRPVLRHRALLRPLRRALRPRRPGGFARPLPGLRRPPAFGRARAALRYDQGAKRLILPFKHADRTELGGPLAAHMARAGADLLAHAELVVPVPAHWRRRLHRRYDQAALLARAVARFAGRPCAPDLLRRVRHTPALGDRGAAERSALVADAFALRRGRAPLVAGRRVLLVDDVLTSGATADACARVLLEAGAAAVDALAAARVPDPRLEDGVAG